jgi:hypothetical protein
MNPKPLERPALTNLFAKLLSSIIDIKTYHSSAAKELKLLIPKMTDSKMINVAKNELKFQSTCVTAFAGIEQHISKLPEGSVTTKTHDKIQFFNIDEYKKIKKNMMDCFYKLNEHYSALYTEDPAKNKKAQRMSDMVYTIVGIINKGTNIPEFGFSNYWWKSFKVDNPELQGRNVLVELHKQLMEKK